MFFLPCSFRVMNSICRGNNENPLSVSTITQSRETTCWFSAEKLFFHGVYLRGNVYKFYTAHSLWNLHTTPIGRESRTPGALHRSSGDDMYGNPKTCRETFRSLWRSRKRFFGGGKSNCARTTCWDTGAKKSASWNDHNKWISDEYHLTLYNYVYTRKIFIIYNTLIFH